jgi:hypothetical protein
LNKWHQNVPKFSCHLTQLLGDEYNLSYNQLPTSCEFDNGHIESNQGWTRNRPLGRTICYHNIEYNVGHSKPSQQL